MCPLTNSLQRTTELCIPNVLCVATGRLKFRLEAKRRRTRMHLTQGAKWLRCRQLKETEGARQPVPTRQAEYAVMRIVGKAKQGQMSKVFWKSVDTGEPCGKDECTWEGLGAFDGDSGSMLSHSNLLCLCYALITDCNLCSGKADASQLNGSEITVKEQSSVYTATLKATKNNSIAEITSGCYFILGPQG